jgi:hypothetical protein
MTLIVGTNSYGSRADADTHFTDSLKNVTWSAFSTTLRDQALVEATRILERQSYAGAKGTPDQTLAFGRSGILNREGVEMTIEESLSAFKIVQFEYAFILLTNLNLVDSTNGSNGLKSFKSSSTTIVFTNSGKSSRFPSAIQEMISIFLAGSIGSVGSTYASGTDDESSFGVGRFDQTTGFY